MAVLKVPARLKFAVAAFLLVIPLALIECVLVLRAPWWKLPYQSLELWAIVSAMVSLPLAFWISNGRRWALYGAGGVSTVWVAASVYLSIKQTNFWLGLFTLGLGLYLIWIWFWMKRELARSFFDPRLRWFQGLPKGVPGLHCQVQKQIKTKTAVEKKWVDCRVSRIDEDGAFLFVDEARDNLQLKGTVDLRLQFGEKVVLSQGAPIRITRAGQGLGVKFTERSPDRLKELDDFVEHLRGAGYV